MTSTEMLQDMHTGCEEKEEKCTEKGEYITDNCNFSFKTCVSACVSRAVLCHVRVVH